MAINRTKKWLNQWLAWVEKTAKGFCVKKYKGKTCLRLLRFEEKITPSIFLGGVNVATGDFNGDGYIDILTGPGFSGGPDTRVFSGLDGKNIQDFFAFDSLFRGGESVTSGDVTGDGVPEIITGSGVGIQNEIRVFNSQNGSLLNKYQPFPTGFTGGVRIATGDVNNDGRVDIIAVPASGYAPDIRIISGKDGTDLGTVTGFETSFPGGAYVASADFDNDGYSDLVIGAGNGLLPKVRILSGKTKAELRTIDVFESTFAGGVTVATGDVNGDGTPDIVTSAGQGGGPRIRAFSGRDGSVLADFMAYSSSFRGGANVATADLDADGVSDIITGAGPTGGPHIRAFGLNQNQLANFFAYEPVMLSGGFSKAASLLKIQLNPNFDSGIVGDNVTNFTHVSLSGNGTPGAAISYQNYKTTVTANGTFQIPAIALQLGENNIEVTQVSGGLQNSASITVKRDALADGTLVLDESNTFGTSQTVLVDLPATTSSRVIRIPITAGFDNSDIGRSLDDRFLISLVDPVNISKTILDRGLNGTTLFSLTTSGHEKATGLVRFDGQVVEINTSSVNVPDGAKLLFQLIGADADTGTEILIGKPNQIESNSSESQAQLVEQSQSLVAMGEQLDVASLVVNNELSVHISNVRYDDSTGELRGEIRVRNDGNHNFRTSVVRIVGLPNGVTANNATGTLTDGSIYLNLSKALPEDGLLSGASSLPVEFFLTNPSLARFQFQTEVLVGHENRPPSIDEVAPIVVLPGGVFTTTINSSDPDGDRVTLRMESEKTLPNGMLSADRTLSFSPSPDQVGNYEFSIVASDGVVETSRLVQIQVPADPVTTTRISGKIQATDLTSLANLPVEVGTVHVLTDAEGRFTLDFGDTPPDAALPLRVLGRSIPGNFPFIAEPIPLLLNHKLYPSVNNVIARTIYLPMLNDGTQIDPTMDTTVSKVLTPGDEPASVFVKAGTLKLADGSLFDGKLSITEVPVDRTPAALPASLCTNFVVTIQPGEMKFSQPAPLTLPNRGNLAPGTRTDLWSINPATGYFDDVGDGIVSADGKLIETVSGGIRNSSWHFFSPGGPTPGGGGGNNQGGGGGGGGGPGGPGPGGGGCNGAPEDCYCGVTSSVETHSGSLREEHNVVSYQSLGETRGVTLHYDSQRADARQIIYFGYENTASNFPDLRMIARIQYGKDGFRNQLPGYVGDVPNLMTGDHIWSVPQGADNAIAALQLPTEDSPSGIYSYELGVKLVRVASNLCGSYSIIQGTYIHVNTRNSAFGAGWGIGGLQELVFNEHGLILLIDGSGERETFSQNATDASHYDPAPGDFSTFVKRSDLDGRYVRSFTDGSETVFTSDGKIESHKDRNGNLTRYEYENGIIARIIDPAGLITHFNVTGSKITSIIDPQGRVTKLRFDEAGNLIQVEDPDTAKRTWNYDAKHHMTGEVDANGNSETAIFDFAGRVSGAIRKDKSTVEIMPVQTRGLLRPADTINPSNPPHTFEISEPTATIVDGNGSVIKRVLDQDGQLVRQSDDIGRTGTVFRNSNNLTTQKLDGRGYITSYEHDARGNVTSISDTISVGNSKFVIDPIEGSENPTTVLLNSLIQSGSGISVVDGSAKFVGRVGDGKDPNTAQSAVFSGMSLRGSKSSLPTISLPDGILLTTGVANLPQTNTSEAFGASALGINFPPTGADADLEAILAAAGQPASTNNTNSFEFQFTVPQGRTSIESDIVLGSEEFPDQAVTDIVGFFVDGVNYAKFPDGSLMSFVQGINALNYNNNDVGTSNYKIEYDGISNSLHIVGILDSSIPAGQPHKVKIAVANTLDQIFDTGVFVSNLVSGTATMASSGLRLGTLRKTFEYDSKFSQLTKSTDELGYVTLYEVDPANGNRLSMTRVMGLLDSATNGETNDLVTRYSYTPQGLIDTMTDPRGIVTDYDYDSMGRVITVTTAKGTVDEAVMRYEYRNANGSENITGNPSAMIDGNGYRTEYTYDSLNRLIQLTQADPDGAGPQTSPVTQFAYDTNGNMTAMTDALGHTTNYEYDSKDRMIRMIAPDPDGNGPTPRSVTQYVYDENGNRIAVVDPNQNVTCYEYDSRDRQTAMINPDGGVVRYGYDADNNVISITDPMGNFTQFAFDSRNRQVAETDPLGKTIRYEYDGANNLVKKTDRTLRVTEYKYDDVNRLTTEIWVGGGNVIEYAYDSNSNLISGKDQFSSLVYTYDFQNRMKTADNKGTPGAPNVVLTYNYDDNGNVLSVSDTIEGKAGAVTSYNYDELNRLGKLTQSGADTAEKRVDFAYNSLGQYTGMSRFSDLAGLKPVIATAYTYDGMNRLGSITHGQLSNPVQFFTYAYDTGSRITQIASKTDIVNYSYDKRDELTNADYLGNTQVDESYRYDANGNRIESHLHGTGYQTDPKTANRLKSDGIYNYEYDNNGNMIKRTTITDGTTRVFNWDYRNRLTNVTDTLQSGTILQKVSFDYDVTDRRISRTNSGVITHMAYDREDVILDFAGNSLETRYLHGPGIDQILSQEKFGSVQWLMTDHLGSIRAIKENDREQLIDFDSYGNPITSLPSRYGFTGRERDTDTELWYYRSRYYTGSGLFISPDPIYFNSAISSSYSYVNDNPVNRIDPLGQNSIEVSGTILSTQGHVEFRASPGSPWVPATNDTLLLPGSALRTGEDGRAVVLRKDGFVDRLFPNSLYELCISVDKCGKHECVSGPIRG